MIRNADRQAFLIVTPEISKHVLKLYSRLRTATSGLGDVYLLFHSKDGKAPESGDINIDVFTNDIFDNLGYTPIQRKLVPGSNHFPVLGFYLKHPQYKYYWCIEDDVVFSGKWNNFFAMVSPEKKYDFITSHIRSYKDLPNWYWWHSLKYPSGAPDKNELVCSFNPIYRISGEALKKTDELLKAGYVGHHEVLLPTLLKKNGYTLADFSNRENTVSPVLSLCTLRTMRWKPVFIIPGALKNMLYHPVKSKITWDQLLVYIKRTIRNKKEYFT